MLKGISVVGTTAEEYTYVKTRRRWIHLVVVVVVVVVVIVVCCCSTSLLTQDQELTAATSL